MAGAFLLVVSSSFDVLNGDLASPCAGLFYAMNAQNQSMKEEIVTATAKAAPPLAVSGLTISGVTLQDWVYIATLVYLAFQIFVIVRDKIVNYRSKGAARGQDTDAQG